MEQLFANEQSVNTKLVGAWLDARNKVQTKWRLEESLKGLLARNQFSPMHEERIDEWRAEENRQFAMLVQDEKNGLPVSDDSKAISIRLKPLESSERSVQTSGLFYYVIGTLFIIAAFSKWIQSRVNTIARSFFNTIQLHPWRMFTLVGIWMTLVFPLTWVGPFLVLVSFILILRQYAYQVKSFPVRLF